MTLFRSTTPQGTEILIEPIPHVRSCSLGFWVKRGSIHETAHEEGLAHFIEHTVFKGTTHYPTPEAMATATDRLGGHVDAFTGKEVACFYGKVLAEQLPDLAHLLGDLISAPIFDEEELGRERGVILEEIAQSEDTPDDWVSELFYERYWRGGPLAHSILGTREQVAAYGPEAARAFFEHTYRAPNLLIAAAGDIDPEALTGLLAPLLDGLPAGGATPHPGPSSRSPFLLNVPRKELQQTSLILGFPAPDHRSEDRVAANLLGHVLGGGMASRLFMELRERHGLCYQVGSYLTHYAGTGSLQISASCAPKHVRELARRTVAECAALRAKGISAEELDRAKLQARTQLVFGQESASSRMFTLAHQAIHQGEIRDLDAHLRDIADVDLDQLNAIAERYLDPATLGVAALGTKAGSEIREQDLVA